MSQPIPPSQPSRRRPGRPRRTPEERAAAKERRIPISQQGRLKFRPGDPHALDVQFNEARNYRQLIAAKLAQLQAILSELDTQDDPSAAISTEEAALKSFLWTTYAEHKHREHILATFLAIRRARLLAKLDAVAAALQVAADLLAPDDSLLQDLQEAVSHQRQAAARQLPQPKPSTQVSEDSQVDQVQESHSVALVRVTGSDEEAVQAQLDVIRTERERQEEAIKRIDNRHIYGDVGGTRQRLERFEAQAAEIRAAMSPAVGWFETFYIEKVRLNREALRYLKKGQKVPPGIDLFEGVIYGPYLKYRWQEVTGGPQYTIQMGITPEGSAQDNDEERGGDPYPNL